MSLDIPNHPDEGDPSTTNDLWSLDLDANGLPVLAHRIVMIEQPLPGMPDKDIRITACGDRRDETTRCGWWWVSKGELPLGLASANHCGVRSTEL